MTDTYLRQKWSDPRLAHEVMYSRSCCTFGVIAWLFRQIRIFKGCLLYRRSAYFNMQEKTTSTVEVTTNFIKKFKAHFEKKLNNNFGLDSFCCYTDLLSSSTVEVVFFLQIKIMHYDGIINSL